MGAANPRCSRVCMRRTFMAVEVDMPRRAKSASARRLISGLTRKEMVEVADMICIPLIAFCIHYNAECRRLQAITKRKTSSAPWCFERVRQIFNPTLA